MSSRKRTKSNFLYSEHLVTDALHGYLVMSFSLCAFISLFWLREQIVHGGGPDWLDEPAPQEEVS